MALKVELKRGERIIVGECVITNSDQRTRLLIDGQVPILREKDILTPETADTPAKLIYLAVQLMYTAKSPEIHHGVYFDLVRDVLNAVPSTGPLIADIGGKPTQLGIVSWGEGPADDDVKCGHEDVYGVYSRVASFADWIKSHLAEN